MNKTYDLIIIGGGPAGTAAAVYAARKQLTTLLVTGEFGGQSIVSETIYNWIGTPEISGADLAKNLESHVRYYEGEYLDIKKGQWITSVVKNDDGLFSVTANNETYSTKTVLVTTGSNRRKLEIDGADAFEHRGVVYCASCDGPLFSGMPVAVIGGGNAAFESAAQLLAYCPVVYLINRSDSFRADEITVNTVSKHPNIRILKNTTPVAVVGEKFVTGLTVNHTDTDTTETLELGGVFVEIGQIPNTDYVTGVDKNETGNIKIDPWTQSSSLSGLWAAGDCTNILYHQNNIATGNAVTAVEDIYVYLKTK